MESSAAMRRDRTVAIAKMPLDVRAEELQDSLIAASNSVGGVPDVLILDFTDARFVDVIALQGVIAEIEGRNRLNLDTEFLIPRKLSVRQFMRRWHFAEALRDACGIPLSALVPSEDLKYFRGRASEEDEPEGYLPHRYEGLRGESAIVELESRFFFSFLTRRLDTEPLSQVTKERARWKDRLVRSFFALHFDADGDYVPSRVVFEAMMNAVRHPNSTVVQAVAKLDGSPKAADIWGHLTIQFWDNGASIIDTLRAPLLKDKPIRYPSDPEFDRQYLLFASEWGEKRGAAQKFISKDFALTASSAEGAFLIGSVLPGITRDPTGEGLIVDDEIIQKDPRLAKPGMGLYLLVNTVVDIFSGSVAIRSGNSFLNIGRARKRDIKQYGQHHYRVRLRTIPSSVSPYNGNSISIRVPLQRRDQ
jgi:hypothetical protein